MTSPHRPLLDMRVRTPRLELRPPNEATMFGLDDLAEQGIHEPDYMPFLRAWTREHRAVTGAFHDNSRALAVTATVGYEPNGDQIRVRDGRSVRCLDFKMARSDWETRRRSDIAIDGLQPCLELFGLDGAGD